MTTTGKPHCQIGDAVGLGRAGELQRHQEVRGLAHAAREAVLHRRRWSAARRRRTARCGRSPARTRSSMVERAAEAHAAEHGEFAAPLEQQADELQEILVPAHGDAVFGDAAEAGHDAVVEPLVELLHVADRAERHARRRARRRRRSRRGSGSILSPSTRDDGVAVIHQVMREREAGGAEPDHQHLVAASRASAAAGADRAGSSASAGRRSRSPRAAPARP